MYIYWISCPLLVAACLIVDVYRIVEVFGWFAGKSCIWYPGIVHRRLESSACFPPAFVCCWCTACLLYGGLSQSQGCAESALRLSIFNKCLSFYNHSATVYSVCRIAIQSTLWFCWFFPMFQFLYFCFFITWFGVARQALRLCVVSCCWFQIRKLDLQNFAKYQLVFGPFCEFFVGERTPDFTTIEGNWFNLQRAQCFKASSTGMSRWMFLLMV